MSGSEKGMMGRSSAGTMTFWVIMLGNPEVDDVFLNTPSPRTGSGADKRGTPTLRGGGQGRRQRLRSRGQEGDQYVGSWSA